MDENATFTFRTLIYLKRMSQNFTKGSFFVFFFKQQMFDFCQLKEKKIKSLLFVQIIVSGHTAPCSGTVLFHHPCGFIEQWDCRQ